MNYLIVTTDPVSAEQDALEYAKSYNPSDVFWVKKSSDKKEITVDVINDMINQSNLSAVADKKLFIVFQAELMNTSAQNKLLKTIEEASNTTVLFLCQNLDRILPTIRSRCMIKYHQSKENKTIQQLETSNPDTTDIKKAAHQFMTANTIDTALSCLPILSKPENLTLALYALNYELSLADFTVEKKLRIYQALAKITRNIAANCNATNTFDLLLLARF